MKTRQISISLTTDLDGDDLTNVANALIELEILLRDSRFKIGYFSSYSRNSDSIPTELIEG